MKIRIFLKTVSDFVYGMISFVSAFFITSFLLNLFNRIIIEQNFNTKLVIEEIQTAFLIVYYYRLIWIPLSFLSGFICALKGKRNLLTFIFISMISFVVIYIMRIFLLI